MIRGASRACIFFFFFCPFFYLILLMQLPIHVHVCVRPCPPWPTAIVMAMVLPLLLTIHHQNIQIHILGVLTYRSDMGVAGHSECRAQNVPAVTGKRTHGHC